MAEICFMSSQAESAAVTQELKRTSAHPVLATAWGPSGQPLISCEKNGTVTVWAKQ